MRVMAVRRAGGPDVLELVDVPEPTPGPGQALVEVHAAGVNFMDIGVRQGLFWTEMPYPKVLGVEGAQGVQAVRRGLRGPFLQRQCRRGVAQRCRKQPPRSAWPANVSQPHRQCGS